MTRYPHQLSTFAVSAALALSLAAPARAAAQGAPAKRVEVPTIAPRRADVATVDAILAAFYDVISGPAGQPRQWARDRTLYIPGVRFVSVGVRPGATKPTASVMDHQQFVDRSDAGMVRGGFYEREIHRVTQRFGNIAHVFSTYEMRTTLGGPVIGRGVNSIQLFYDGDRWWIASAQWDDERPGNPIPKEFLP